MCMDCSMIMEAVKQYQSKVEYLFLKDNSLLQDKKKYYACWSIKIRQYIYQNLSIDIFNKTVCQLHELRSPFSYYSITSNNSDHLSD